MSCPHPRGPVERIVGPFTELVCPDCHARLAVADEPEVIEGEAVEVDETPSMTAVEIQAVYNEAFEIGILEEPRVFDPADAVSFAAIEEFEGERVLVFRVDPAPLEGSAG